MADGPFAKLRRAEINATGQGLGQDAATATMTSFGSAVQHVQRPAMRRRSLGDVDQEGAPQSETQAGSSHISGSFDEFGVEPDWAADVEAQLRQHIAAQEGPPIANESNNFDAVDEETQNWVFASQLDRAGESPDLTDGSTSAELSEASTPHPMSDTSTDSFRQETCICDDDELPNHNMGSWFHIPDHL